MVQWLGKSDEKLSQELSGPTQRPFCRESGEIKPAGKLLLPPSSSRKTQLLGQAAGRIQIVFFYTTEYFPMLRSCMEKGDAFSTSYWREIPFVIDPGLWGRPGAIKNES
jgi:hypothetical protein